MKIYLDVCSLQRPLDTKSHIRIVLEAEAILGIVAACEAGDIELISSEALLFEVNRNPNLTRRDYVLEVLSKANEFVEVDEQVEKRAKEFNAIGIKPLDALHLALAEKARVDYFCTCDDRFMKKAKSIAVKTKVVSPLELIKELEP